jgi:hypothetical protein
VLCFCAGKYEERGNGLEASCQCCHVSSPSCSAIMKAD